MLKYYKDQRGGKHSAPSAPLDRNGWRSMAARPVAEIVLWVLTQVACFLGLYLYIA